MNIAHINQLEEEQTVEQHCVCVAEIAATYGKTVGMEHLSYLAGLLHDMGKDTLAFTTYIREQHLGISKQKRGDINHSSAGAKYLNNLIQPSTTLEKLTCQLISYAIAAHHGIFDIITEEGEDHYIHRIDPDKEIFYQEVVDNCQQYITQDKVREEFKLAVKDIAIQNEKIKKLLLSFDPSSITKNKLPTVAQFIYGCLQRLILSIVIDADRIDTNNFMTIRCIEEKYDLNKLWSTFSNQLEKHIEKLPKEGKIAVLRSEISKECQKFYSNNTGIYRLSCPTGGGKTIASFRYALAHANKYKKEHIIYIAPYRAILEQNAEVIKKALKDEVHILEHHSDLIPEDNERYQYLTERYNSPIIFTTMVQFLNTLFSHQTQSIRRFHNFSNSILIIDEVQSIPVKCIHLFNQMMNFLSQCCNTTVILCTATQPALDQVLYPIIFNSPSEIINNLPQKYKAFKRVNIVDARRTIGYNAASLRELIMNKLMKCNSILVIVNTKDVARKCYEECKDYLQTMGNDEVLLYHLSTNMCPQHRINKLDEVKKNIEHHRIICISTQLIEAGVDISFQCVIRSFAGLDSIAQAAGRCNRHGQNDLEEVLIVNCVEENITKLEDIKLGQEATGLILDSYKAAPELVEEDLLSIKVMNKFYERYYFSRVDEMNYSIRKWNTSLWDMLSMNTKGCMEAQQKESKGNYMLRQAFETAGKEFEVIDSNTTGILVPYRDGIEIINDLNSASCKKDVSLQLKLAQRYTVNVYSHILHLLEDRGAIYELMLGGIYALKDAFYNEVTGLQLDGEFDCMIQ